MLVADLTRLVGLEDSASVLVVDDGAAPVAERLPGASSPCGRPELRQAGPRRGGRLPPARRGCTGITAPPSWATAALVRRLLEGHGRNLRDRC